MPAFRTPEALDRVVQGWHMSAHPGGEDLRDLGKF